jgi:hypothetical protein
MIHLEHIYRYRRSYNMINYEEVSTSYGISIKRTDIDGSIWFIPTDPANSDYQEYLKWAEANNV